MLREVAAGSQERGLSFRIIRIILLYLVELADPADWKKGVLHHAR